MSNKSLYLKAVTNIVLYTLAVTLLITVFPRIFAFFLPFVVGWIISMMANPIVKFFEEKIKFKRKAGSAIVIVLVLALIIFICYMIITFLVTQGLGLATSLPEKWPEFQNQLDNFGKKFSLMTSYLPDDLKTSIETLGKKTEEYLGNIIGKLGSPTWNALSKFAKSLPSTIIAIVMGGLSAYFFTVEHNTLSDSLKKVTPSFIYSRLEIVSRGIKHAVGGYIVAQIKIEVWVYIITVIGLLILSVDYAAIIALGIAFLDFLPVFGAGAVMVPWAVICGVNGDYFTAAGMLIIWGVGQLVRQLIQPKIVGDSMGMKPIPTLFLLYIGFEFAGVVGMIIAVPIGIITVSLYKEGVFDTFINSLKIVWRGINNFRKLPKNIDGVESAESVDDLGDKENEEG